MSEVLVKLAACDYPAVRSRLSLEAAAASTITRCQDGAEAFSTLERTGLLMEAAQLAAYALPKRDAIHWACLCADHTVPDDLPDADRSAREASDQWLRFQTDLIRRYAMDRAEAAGFRSPESWAAVAVFWSGGSIAPLGEPRLSPAPDLTGKAVFAAIQMSAARGDPAEEKLRLRWFLDRAREIAAAAPEPKSDRPEAAAAPEPEDTLRITSGHPQHKSMAAG